MSEEPPEMPVVGAARRLEKAYERVFGQPGARTTDQALVMQDLEAHCYAFRLVSEGKVDGDVASARALFNDGRRSVWLRVRGQLIRASSEPRKIRSSRVKQSSW